MANTDDAKVKMAQALKAFAENQPAMADMMTLAKDSFMFYKACVAAGFTEAQALHLTAARLQRGTS